MPAKFKTWLTYANYSTLLLGVLKSNRESFCAHEKIKRIVYVSTALSAQIVFIKDHYFFTIRMCT